MTIKVEEPIYFFAVHPRGMQGACLSHMQTIGQPEDIPPGPWMNYTMDVNDIDKEDQDTKSTHTRFRFADHVPRSDFAKHLQSLRRSVPLMDELQVVIFEDATYRISDNHVNEEGMRRLLDRFFMSAKYVFVDEMLQASRFISSLKATPCDFSSLQINVTIETIEREWKWKERLTSWADSGELARELRSIAALSDYPGWIINEPDRFTKEQPIFQLKIYMDYTQICVGVQLMSEYDFRPYMVYERMSGALATYMVRLAEIGDKSIVADLSCGSGCGETALNALAMFNCICFAISSSDEDGFMTRANWLCLRSHFPPDSRSRRYLDLIHYEGLNKSLFNFYQVTHLLCCSPLRYKDASLEEIIEFYERLFAIIENSMVGHGIAVIAIPFDHADIVFAACDSQKDDGTMEYNFECVYWEKMTTMTDAIYLLRLETRTNMDTNSVDDSLLFQAVQPSMVPYMDPQMYPISMGLGYGQWDPSLMYIYPSMPM